VTYVIVGSGERFFHDHEAEAEADDESVVSYSISTSMKGPRQRAGAPTLMVLFLLMTPACGRVITNPA
jgi:hypothetical protein